MKYSFKAERRKKNIEKLARPLVVLQWKYKSCMLLVISLVVAVFFLKSSLQSLVERLGTVSYIGALIGGIFYSFSLTVAPSVAVLYSLGKKLNPFLIASVGASGAVLGDYLIFRFVRDNLAEEIKMLYEGINSKFYFKDSVFYHIFPFSNLLLSPRFKLMLFKMRQSKTYSILIKILAGVIVASPLPNELGIALLGAAKQKAKEFILYAYLLNFIGIFGVCYLARFY